MFVAGMARSYFLIAGMTRSNRDSQAGEFVGPLVFWHTAVPLDPFPIDIVAIYRLLQPLP
jgi:hypothetical protein